MMFNLNELISGAGSIAISGHVRPDGDSVGSTLALYNYIKKKWPEKETVLYLEEPSETFSYLKGFEEAVTFKRGMQERIFDLFFALDLGDMERLGDAGRLFKKAKKTACVDHHISNTGFGKYSHIVSEASSTSELIFDFMDKDALDVEIAKCIYTGIIHDTGVLQYSNTSKHTLEVTGQLIEFGFDFTTIINETFYEKTYVQNQIMGRALMESILFMDGICIASVIDKKTMDFYGVTSKDFNGVANQLYKTKGVEVAIFMYESSDVHMLYKVSLRGDGRFNLAELAKKFGGGGHVRAAGFSMNGTWRDILNNISAELCNQMAQENP